MMALLVHRRALAESGEEAKPRRKIPHPLQRAEKADAEDDTAKFYAALAEALMSQAGRILSREARGLSIEDAAQGLRGRGIARELTNDFSILLERCQSIPYLPNTGSAERRQDLENARRVVRELEKIRP